MNEVINNYFKGLKNYFNDFDKSKFYHLVKIFILILLLICFNVISIPCFLFYKYGFYRATKQINDKLERKTPTILSGIHTHKSNELISISEVNLLNNHEKK